MDPSSSECEIINEAIQPPLQPLPLPPPPPSDCENNKSPSLPPPPPSDFENNKSPVLPPPPPPLPAAAAATSLSNEDLTIYKRLLQSSLDCEEFSDKDAEEKSGIDLIKAAMYGNAKVFDEPNLSYNHFSRKSLLKNNNILHIALRYNQKEFVRALLSKEKYLAINKKLISERNSNENTPLHVAAQTSDENTVKLLYGLYKYARKNAQGDAEEEEEEKPWRVKNLQGNTALHVALLSRNIEVAKFLVERDGFLARTLNNSQEAPLHLAITHLYDEDGCIPMTRVLLEKARCVATWCDENGLTPLLRTASLPDTSVILQVTKNIIDVCPESTLVCDKLGKSFLHHLVDNNKIFDHSFQKNLDKRFKLNYKNIEDLLCLNEISILKNHQDHDENTPLHTALLCGNINMARSLVSKKCSADAYITNKNGISAWSIIQQKNLWHQLHEPRAMTKEESRFAEMRDINNLVKIQHTTRTGFEFYGSKDGEGRNFFHLLMSKTAEHHYLISSSDDYGKFFGFIEPALNYFPRLVCQRDQTGNTPVHILARNKEFCKTLADPKWSESSTMLSKLLSICAKKRITFDEADNHDLPWIMQNSDGNTPLHEAIIANNKLLVLELLRYNMESAGIVNKHKETPLHLLAATRIGTMEFTVEEVMEIVAANIEALGLPDKDGLIPMSTALKVENEQMVVAILCIVQNYSDNDGQNSWHLVLNHSWHLVLNHSSNNFVNHLLQYDAFRTMLKQKDKDGYTPLHLAMKEKCYEFVENILETWGREQQLSGGQQLENNQWLMDLLEVRDKDGRNLIIRALIADNTRLAIRLCRVNPEAAKMGDNKGKTIWHFLSVPPLYKSESVKKLLETESLRKLLKQKDNDGNTPLHLAISGNCFDFVQDLLEASKSELELSKGEQWPMDLLRTPNRVGETPEDLLAEKSTLPDKLEKKLLTDRRMMGIRSSWKIPRTQLQNYMKSINVIAALQTTITFTAAFTVPGGPNQDKGFPILISSIAFQVFMISDVIAMCLSMMVLICPFWMVSGTKCKSVEIQDFTLSLLQASFVATLLTFMSGVFATIYPVKPWIAITTLVLCSLLTLLLRKLIVTKLLLPFYHATVHFVKKLWDPVAEFFSKTIKRSSSIKESDNPDRFPDDEHNNV